MNPLLRKIKVATLAAIFLVVPALSSAAPAPITLGKTCTTSECHTDIQKSQFLHGPVNLNQCEPCHVPIQGRHEFAPIQTGPELCQTCHDIEKSKAVVHSPFASDCTLCHQPHGGDNRHFVKGGEGAGQCLLCHEDTTKDMKHMHGPVAAGECLVCHSPHQSDHESLLLEPRRDLCLGCHIDVGNAMKEAIAVHKPVEEGCSGCHDAHGGNNDFFLPSDGSDLCLKCHGEFIETAHQAKYPHAPMVEGKACRNCHSPHASSQQGLLSTNTSELCLTCHNVEIHRENDSITNVAEHLEKSTFLHGPIREKNCVACHQAHGSDVASILRKSFPRDFYAPYEQGAYDLCFECHDRTIAEAEVSTTTNFRDGDKNLHFLHVNKEKGRTCRACHDEHGSVQPVNMRSEVPFGRWQMKVEYTKTDTGGTCSTGCHVPYSYDRITPVGTAEPK